MSALLQQILAVKRQRRLALAALPFPEKVRIVEQMRQTLTSVRAPAPRSKTRTAGAESGTAEAGGSSQNRATTETR